MHVLGLANGSLGSNSTILLKAALLAAKEVDPSITVSWIHVPSVSYPPNPGPLVGAPDISAGTNASSNSSGTITSDSNMRDDRRGVFNAILNADALIFSTAVYSHAPAGALKALLDTLLGPYTDPALAIRILENKKNGNNRYGGMRIDERVLKPRVTGFMAVGGSTTPDQFTLALPTLHLMTYGLHVKVVDQIVFQGYANPGAVLQASDDEILSRARTLGQNVVSQIGKTFDDALYFGPEPEGACPHCHLSKIDYFGGAENRIGCAVCGNTGRLVSSSSGMDTRIVPLWDEDSEYCCITMKGKQKHVDDIFKNGSAEWKGISGDTAFKKRLEEWRVLDVGEIKFSEY